MANFWVNPLLPPGTGPTFFSGAGSFIAAPALTTASQSTLSGTDSTALQAALYGKDIPIFVGGQALMGCRLIEGPFLHTTDDVTLVDFIASCAVSANPSATRTIMSLRLNGTESWTSAGGPIGTPFAGMSVNVKAGTEDQTPFASSVSRYGASAVAYRSNICIEVLNCPLDPFNNVIPFASIFVHETDSIARSDALAVLAAFSRFDSSEVEFNVSGSDTFWIVPQQTEFIQYLQNLRTIFRNWNITATDKLRVFENDAGSGVTSTITRDKIVAGTAKFTRADPLSIERARILSFIATDMDNQISTVTGLLERFPVPATASQTINTVELPIGMASDQAQTLVSKSLIIDDIARKTISFTGMNALYGSEAGDIIYFADDPAIQFIGRITSVAAKAADYGTDITAEQISFLGLANVAPIITSNGGGSTASVTINENTTAVTTVTATDANNDLIAFSIIGGADAGFFAINTASGALAFRTPPDFEAPLDADFNNQYVVVVQASDGDLTDTQTITVTVADVAEPGDDDSFLLLLD